MPRPEDFDPEQNPIYWPTILAVFAAQMIALIAMPHPPGAIGPIAGEETGATSTQPPAIPMRVAATV